MVLPHQIFGYMYEHHPDNFAIRFLGGAGARVADAANLLRSSLKDYIKQKKSMAM